MKQTTQQLQKAAEALNKIAEALEADDRIHDQLALLLIRREDWPNSALGLEREGGEMVTCAIVPGWDITLVPSLRSSKPVVVHTDMTGSKIRIAL